MSLLSSPLLSGLSLSLPALTPLHITSFRFPLVPPDATTMMNMWPQYVCVSDIVMYLYWPKPPLYHSLLSLLLSLSISFPFPFSSSLTPGDEVLPGLLHRLWGVRQHTNMNWAQILPIDFTPGGSSEMPQLTFCPNGGECRTGGVTSVMQNLCQQLWQNGFN